MFQNPDAFFVNNMTWSEQKFLKVIMKNALKSGYDKLVIPYAGSFNLPNLALQVGLNPNQIETSDISMIGSVLGYTITEQPLCELRLKATGFSDEELSNPATALYAWKYLSFVKNSEKDYFYNYLIDMEFRRSEHIQNITEKLNALQKRFSGINYKISDMWSHINEVKDEPNTLLIVNPFTYKAGFEKFYDTGGNMTWAYIDFDTSFDSERFKSTIQDAKCLVIFYEETVSGKSADTSIFVRQGNYNGLNTYICSNRPDEAKSLANGKKIVRLNEEDLEPLKCPILPTDYEITDSSIVHICKIDRKNSNYYRKLWTHNFEGANAMINIGVFIDDMIAGVFGINTAQLSIGAYGTNVSDSLFLMYDMAMLHNKYRINRLIIMIAQNNETARYICTDLEFEKAKTLKTIMLTKYPTVSSNRGIMKLTERKKDSKFGYRLTYMSDLKERTIQETLSEWLRKEEKWQKSKK